MSDFVLLSTAQTAQLLNVTMHQLAQWRYEGRGPAFVRDGRWIRYRRSAVERWLKSREVYPAREAAVS